MLIVSAAVAVFLIWAVRKEKQNRALLILLLCIDLAGMAAGAAEQKSGGRERITGVPRSSGEEVSLVLETSSGEEMPFDMQIPEREYTPGEIRQKIEESMEILDRTVPGQNKDLSHVSLNLDLPSSLEETGASVLWFSDRPEMLDDEGVLHSGIPEEGTDVSLTGTVSVAGTSEDYVRKIRVFPSKEASAFRETVGEEAVRLNSSNEGDTWVLPDEAGGKKLVWYREEKKRGLMISMLAGIGGLLWILAGRQREAEKERGRMKEMQSDYPEIVSRLLLYLGAGLSMRSSFKRITDEYRRRRNGGAGKREAYEEIARCHVRMERGVTEMQVYQELGDRCGASGYRTLAMLLTQNLRKGSAGVTEQLEREVRDAFEQRKRHARAEGEKATVRLLLPMGMMLAVVLGLIIIPAFISL